MESWGSGRSAAAGTMWPNAALRAGRPGPFSYGRPSFATKNARTVFAGDAQQLCSASRCASRALLHELSRSPSACPLIVILAGQRNGRLRPRHGLVRYPHGLA
jgi:hypothetical protein